MVKSKFLSGTAVNLGPPLVVNLTIANKAKVLAILEALHLFIVTFQEGFYLWKAIRLMRLYGLLIENPSHGRITFALLRRLGLYLPIIMRFSSCA